MFFRPMSTKIRDVSKFLWVEQIAEFLGFFLQYCDLNVCNSKKSIISIQKCVQALSNGSDGSTFLISSTVFVALTILIFDTCRNTIIEVRETLSQLPYKCYHTFRTTM
jgi:hypothetical protein